MVDRLAFNAIDVKRARGSSITHLGTLECVNDDGEILFNLGKRLKGFLVQRAVDSIGGITIGRIRHALTVISEPVVAGNIKELIGSRKENPDLRLPDGYPTPFSEIGLKQDGSSFRTFWWELAVKGKDFEVTIKSWGKGVTPTLIEKLMNFGYIGDRHGRLTIGEFELVDGSFQVTRKELIVG